MPRARFPESFAFSRDVPRNGVGDVIVISGVLLLVAVVFLIVGLFGPLAWVYASIGVSVLSFVFLLLGVRQRRGVPAGLGTSATAAFPTAPTAAAPAVVPTGLGGDEDVTVVPPTAPAATGAVTRSTGAAATTALRRPDGAAAARTSTRTP